MQSAHHRWPVRRIGVGRLEGLSRWPQTSRRPGGRLRLTASNTAAPASMTASWSGRSRRAACRRPGRRSHPISWRPEPRVLGGVEVWRKLPVGGAGDWGDFPHQGPGSAGAPGTRSAEGAGGPCSRALVQHPLRGGAGAAAGWVAGASLALTEAAGPACLETQPPLPTAQPGQEHSAASCDPNRRESSCSRPTAERSWPQRRRLSTASPTPTA